MQSLTSSTKAGLYDQLLNLIDQSFGENDTAPPFHEYLVEPYAMGSLMT